MEFLKELLKEIRDDLKDTPTNSDANKASEERERNRKEIEKLKNSHTAMKIKVTIISSAIASAATILVKYLLP